MPGRDSDRLRAHGFRFCFTPLSTVLFTFPSRYLSTIGLSGVFSLTGWCRQIQPGFLLSRPTQDTRLPAHASPTGLSPPAAGVPTPFGSHVLRILRVLLPRACLDMHGLGCSAFARRYSRNHCCFLLLRVLRCFSSPGSPPLRDTRTCRVGCPIRKPADRPVCAGPRGLSQLAASFIASESLGIPRAPLST